MRRMPEEGDIVRIGRGRKDQLVIFAEDATDHDHVCREVWPGYVFVTIPYEVGDTVDPKEKNYIISSCRAAGSGETKVELEDVELIGKAKFKEKITKTFTVKE